MEDSPDRSLERRTQTICLLILAAIAIGVTLFLLQAVLVPFVLALFLSMMVTPVMDFQQRRFRMPRWLSIVSTIVIGLVMLVLLSGLITTALADFIAQSQSYNEKVLALWDRTTDGIESLARSTGMGGEEFSLDDELEPLREKMPGLISGAIGWTVNAGLGLISSGLLVAIFMMFLIVGHRRPAGGDRESLSGEVRTRVKEYLRVKILVSAITAVAVYAILKICGIDLALVFALMTFLLNFIPNIGSAVAMLLPVPVVLLTGEISVTTKIVALGLPALVQFLVGNVLEPKWMGSSLDLNPIVILLALIFWGVLWGPVGMLLSVPITAVLKILLQRLPYTRPVADLLADSP